MSSADNELPLFNPRIALEEKERTVCGRPLTSEKELEHYYSFAVEEEVKVVLGQPSSLDNVRTLVDDAPTLHSTITSTHCGTNCWEGLENHDTRQ